MAGVAAEVAAARSGASVCLIERYCGLGGLATLGNVIVWLPLCDGMGNQVVGGLGEEMLRLSVADLGGDHPTARFLGIPDAWQPGGDAAQRPNQRFQVEFNPSSYMLALEKMTTEAGVDLLYDSRFCTVVRDENRLTHVIIENKDGRGALEAGVVIDATGDADVCHAAGERTVWLDSNVLAGWFYSLSAGQLRLHKLSNAYCPKGGKDNAQGPFFRGDTAKDLTQHILQTREQIRERLDTIRAEKPDDDTQLLMPPAMACFRMTRRLVGQIALAQTDMHRWFDDVVGLTGDWRHRGPVYAIPLGSLTAVRTRNLLAVGRCISVDASAWDVTRAIPACVVTGQAAGTAAALACTKTDGDIEAINCMDLQARLEEQGVLLDRRLVAEDRAGHATNSCGDASDLS